MTDSKQNSSPRGFLRDILDNAVSAVGAVANEQVLEPTLSDDPALQESLSKLANKAIAFEIKKVGQTVYFMPHAAGIGLSYDAPEKIDVTVRATPKAIAKIAKEGMEDAELESGDLEIEGDAITGQRFARLLGELDIEWEELLSQRIGDVPAHLVFKGLNTFTTWVSQTRENMKQTTGEYLVEEARVAASGVLVEKYLDDVDTLRNDVARLAARIKRLQK